MGLPRPALPLRLRLAASYALFLMLVVAVLGVYLVRALESNFLQGSDETLALRAAHVELRLSADSPERLLPAQASAALDDLAPLDEFSAPGLYVQVLDPSGEILAHTPNLPAGKLPMETRMIDAALGGQAVYASMPAGRERVRVLAQPVRSGDRVIGVIVVGESMHLLDTTLRRMQQILLVAAASAVGVSLVGGWWLTRRAFGPIAEVTRVARGIATTGQFERRIASPRARDEVGELVETFNDMISRLERTFRRQREFIADASHELRGPLMVIRGNLDLLKLDLPKADREESVQEATEETERMARLVSDLLFLSEVDSQEAVERLPVTLDEVVDESWARGRELDDGAHELALVQNDAVVVVGDRDRLGQLLWNLVENALRYTPAGGKVSIALRRQGAVAEIVVADSGIGIPAEHLPRIFERFYRVDRARSRQQGGTGLGLAIARQVAEAHGGQIRVRSESNEGTTFTVVLPIEV